MKKPTEIFSENNKHIFSIHSKTDESNEDSNILMAINGNLIASNAITARLNEVSKAAEGLDIALREMQNCLEMNRCRSNSLDRKTAEGNTSISSTDVSLIEKKSEQMQCIHVVIMFSRS